MWRKGTVSVKGTFVGPAPVMCDVDQLGKDSGLHLGVNIWDVIITSMDNTKRWYKVVPYSSTYL